MKRSGRISVSVLDSIFRVFTAYLYPFIYTSVGVFLGIYINGLIESERTRTQEILRPIYEEVNEIASENPDTPFQPLLDDSQN